MFFGGGAMAASTVGSEEEAALEYVEGDEDPTGSFSESMESPVQRSLFSALTPPSCSFSLSKQ